LIAAAGTAWGSEPRTATAPGAAFERGVAAYNTGVYSMAVPELVEAAASGSDTAKFFAEYYLARIYADTTSGQTNHAKAFMLFRKLADEFAEVDPEEDYRAPFVAKSLIMLAGYTKSGLRELQLAANPRKAANYLHHAALFFGDKEAQLELAKLYLSGDRSRDDVRRGLHYLSTLSEQSYPAAQALLAEQMWIGEHVKVDQRRALALITMAAERAPAHDRIWIEETYHSMFCAASQGTREEADGLMARWRKMFPVPAADLADRPGLGSREMLPERQCSNGETITIRRSEPVTAAASPSPQPATVVRGSAVSLGYRAASGPDPSAIKK
jgi:hypothetical protein